jgi:hypothetical protein
MSYIFLCKIQCYSTEMYNKHSIESMTEMTLARELGITSMRLQDSFLMIKSFEMELDNLMQKHEAERLRLENEVKSLKDQLNLMQLLLNGISITENVEAEEYQP